MPTHPKVNVKSGFSREAIVFYCALMAFAVAAIALAGWVFDISYFKTILPGFPEMKPNSAVAFAIGAIGLFLISKHGQGENRSRAIVSCGALVSLIGFLTLFEYMGGLDLGIDTMLISASRMAAETRFPGRMSPHSAFNFTVLGISIAALAGGRRFQKLSEFLAILLSVTTFTAVLGYLYGAEQFYGISKFNSMAVQTIGLFFVFSLGIVTANTRSRMVNLLTASSFGGTAARRLLPCVVVLYTLLPWLRMMGEKRGLLDAGSGPALMAVFAILIMGAIILFFSAAIHKTDIGRKHLERDLAERERRYHDLFDYSQGMICIHDLDGVLISVNPATIRSLGYGLDEMVGKNLAEFLPVEHRAGITAFLREITNEGISKGLLPVISKSGQHVMWRYDSILVSEPDEEPYIIGHAQDVTELIAAQKQLKNLSLTDDLTGLYNRRGFLTMAEQQIKLEEHSGTARGLTLMFADMDGLKKINDLYGHKAGSDAIIQLSKILQATLRNADLIARWGGDEFVILTIGSKNENTEMMFDRINDAISEHNLRSHKPYELACSIGVAPIDIGIGRSLEAIIADADKAMYAEKRRRKAARKDVDTHDLLDTLTPSRTSPKDPTGNRPSL